MVVTAQFRFIGAESKISKNGNMYYVMGLLQGMDSEQLFIQQEQYNQVKDFKEFDNVECSLNINIRPDKTNVSLIDVKKIGVK